MHQLLRMPLAPRRRTATPYVPEPRFYPGKTRYPLDDASDMSDCLRAVIHKNSKFSKIINQLHICAPTATRTRDLLLRRQSLYPLSYRGLPRV